MILETTLVVLARVESVRTRVPAVVLFSSCCRLLRKGIMNGRRSTPAQAGQRHSKRQKGDIVYIAIPRRKYANDTLWKYRLYVQSASFYARRRIVQVRRKMPRTNGMIRYFSTFLPSASSGCVSAFTPVHTTDRRARPPTAKSPRELFRLHGLLIAK